MRISKKDTAPNFKYEIELHGQGYEYIAGIDEVGRGAWAGPVVAAAVILPHRLYGVRDSKILTREKRELLARSIKRLAFCYSIGIAEVWEIDEVGVGQAVYIAYQRALEKLPQVDFLVVDGLRWKESPLPHKNMIKGDSKCASIAAASIIAKVERDKMMRQLHRKCTKYGFGIHKGYGTKLHQDKLAKHGVSEHHRKSFRPIKKISSNR